MYEVIFQNRRIQVPERLEELTPELYLKYLALASSVATARLTPESWARLWAAMVCGYGGEPSLLLLAARARFDEIAAAASGFLSGDGSGEFRPRLHTPLNLLPVFHGHKGPGHWLEGLDFESFSECSVAMERLAQASDPGEAEGLCEDMARTLYHIPADEAVPAPLPLHASLLFSSVWREIVAGPVNINGREVDLSIIFRPVAGGETRPDDGTGWLGVGFEVAHSGVFGSMPELRRAPFWEVLLYLYKCKTEYIHELSKQQKKQ